MEIGSLSGDRAAGIDDHDLRAAPLPGREKPLEQDGMAPGHVGADEHDEIGLLQILIGAGHGVGAEGADMSGHGRGHAEAGVGVDVRRADEALHQLVGDVVILGEELARTVEGDRFRPVFGNGFGKARGDEIERLVPAGAAPVDFGMKQPVVEAQRLAQRRTLRAEAAVIGRMPLVPLDRDGAVLLRRRHHTAADAAIGAGGPGRGAARHSSSFRQRGP